MSAIVLDGIALADRRAALLTERAGAVQRRRGSPPGFLLVAFSDERGHVAHVARKLRMCAAAGVDVTPLFMPRTAETSQAIARLHDVLSAGVYDGVFLQFPFPDAIDGDAVAAAIPVALDVDIMTPVRTAQFMNGTASLPPVTVSAALMLLDAWDVSIADRRGIVIAREDPFSLMFRAALVLRGARMGAIVDPHAGDLEARVRAAELVVVAAAEPGLVQASTLAQGSVVIDAGYFNPGGRGDIDLSGGCDHLAAIAPVPGGIGPMTVSALIERVILFAERG